jgi:hypothetical protein
LLGAALPVARNRCDHLTTLAGLMLKVAATTRTLSPLRTRSTARSRKSIDKGFAIHAGLPTSLNGESHQSRFGNPSRFSPIPSRSSKWNAEKMVLPLGIEPSSSAFQAAALTTVA